jgi:serine kinase of HPr protein (carbohydrate metabolism regulator)
VTSVVNIHASCVVLGRAGEPFGARPDLGVLIFGESGAGKSDLALRLIASGATLVADDRCDLFVAAGVLHASVPPTLQGMIEIRGLGIVRLPCRASARIGLAVRLVPADTINRLPEPTLYRPPELLALPESQWPAEIAVAAFEASAPAKIAAAAAAFAA